MGPGDQGENVERGDHTRFYGSPLHGEEQVLGYIGHPGSWKIPAHFTSKAGHSQACKGHANIKTPRV